MKEQIYYFFRAFWGKRRSRLILEAAKNMAADKPSRLRDLQNQLYSGTGNTDLDKVASAPVFILSAGWRSGSTLLQRMILSRRPSILIWGEPYANTNLFDCMLEQTGAFTNEWPSDSFYFDLAAQQELGDQWIANLYPALASFVAAHRAYFGALFEQPAIQAGFDSWGVKEVRLTVVHAQYLRFLYPNAKFLFLVRDPCDAYASYRRTGEWFRSWPKKPIFTPISFAKNWANLAEDYRINHASVDGLLVRYEDLNDAKTVNSIESYLGWKIDKPADMLRVGSSRVSADRPWIPKLELRLLKWALQGEESYHGY